MTGRYISTELTDNDVIIASSNSWTELALVTAELIAESGNNSNRGFEIYDSSDGRLVATFASVDEVLI